MKLLLPLILSAYPFAAVAHAVVDAMPVSKEHLVDHEDIAVGYLMPLAAFVAR